MVKALFLFLFEEKVKIEEIDEKDFENDILMRKFG